MQPDTEIFFEHSRLGGPLAASVALHLAFTGVVVLFGVVLHGHGSAWGAGGGGDAIGVSLVSTLPLPASEAQTQNVLANESKGLTLSRPQVKTIEPDAIPIADKNAKTKPKPVTSASHSKTPAPPAEETNEVPFGQGGPVSGPYGTFSAAGAKGGFSVQGGGGDFGSQYSYYVQGIQRRITENWLRYEIDPNIREANRAYIIFDINRAGEPSHVQIEQSSGVPSLDQSAIRAVQRVASFGNLPAEYSGNKVSVEFWFDYKR